MRAASRIFWPFPNRCQGMTTLRGKSALVIGASVGVGRSTVERLLAEGARVTAVARNPERLAQLPAACAAAVAQGAGTLSTVAGDASDQQFIDDLLQSLDPDAIALVGGTRVSSAPFVDYDWATFSEAWHNDMQGTFHVLKRAHQQPLKPGSSIVVVSSGAAISGSPISGGYSGAKRMQWLLAGYAQKHADREGLQIRTTTIVPRQLIEGTAIAERAATVYGAMEGLTAEQYMSRFPAPLTCDMVADAIVRALGNALPGNSSAYGVSSSGVEPLV